MLHVGIHKVGHQLTTCFWCSHCLQGQAQFQDLCHLAAGLLMCLQLSIQTGEQSHAASLVQEQGQIPENNEECRQKLVLTCQRQHLVSHTIFHLLQAVSMKQHWPHTNIPVVHSHE